MERALSTFRKRVLENPDDRSLRQVYADLLIDGRSTRVDRASEIGFYTYDSCCGFVLDYFRIDAVAPATIPNGARLCRAPSATP